MSAFLLLFCSSRSCHEIRLRFRAFGMDIGEEEEDSFLFSPVHTGNNGLAARQSVSTGLMVVGSNLKTYIRAINKRKD